MKEILSKETLEDLHKIETIEEEISDLKLSILKKLTPSKKNLLSLKGFLKGVKVSDTEIEEVKQSLYSKIAI